MVYQAGSVLARYRAASAPLSPSIPTSSDPVQQKKDEASFQQGKAMIDNIGLIPAAMKRMQVLALLGTAGGLGYAYKKGSGVGGYFGWAILFSFVGTLVAIASVKIVPPKQ